MRCRVGSRSDEEGWAAAVKLEADPMKGVEHAVSIVMEAGHALSSWKQIR